MGHLLYILGNVEDKTLRRYERDATNAGKGSFMYAWVLDQTETERSRGVTVDISMIHFETENRHFTLLDAPGHRDFVPNMIMGASQADVGMLVVDATPGEFESGFEADGQTKEHALLMRSLGVQQMLVAINKLDAADWSEERFNHIVETVGFFLTQAAGFPKGKISYVPTSGITGDNLKTCKDTRLTAWYHGKTLLQRLDEFQPPERPLDKPFTLSVADFWKSGTRISVSGKVDTGTIQLNETVLLQPLNEVATVKTIEVNGSEGHEWAVSGDQVVLGISGPIDIQIMSVSLVLSNPSSPVKVSSHLEARIVVFDIAVPIIPGFRVNFHRQSISEPANISQLISIVDKGTGQSVKRRPRALTKNTAAMVRIVLEKSICVETFKASRDLGRFTLRSGGRTVAAGMVTDVLAYSTVRARDS